MSYWDDVNQRALEDCPRLLYEILPGGVVSKGHYHCATIAGGEGKSFDVNLQKGMWGDWADNTAPRGGNIIDLYAAVKGLDRKAALRELAERYGVNTPGRRKKVNWRPILPIPDDAPLLIVDELFHGEPIGGVWKYTNAEGHPLMARVRVNKPTGEKDRVPSVTYCRNSETGAMEWRVQAPPQPWPLYNLPALTAGPHLVLVVEGEKTADAGQRLLPDWCVTTWPGGSNSVDQCDWNPLVNLKDALVTFWPDNDKPGQAAMSRAAEILGRPAAIIELDPRWPEHYDLADLENDGWTTEQVEAWIQSHSRKVTPAPADDKPIVTMRGGISSRVKAIFDAINSMPRQELFYFGTDVVRIVHNSFGTEELVTMNQSRISAWCSTRLELQWPDPTKTKGEAMVADSLAEAIIMEAPRYLPTLLFRSSCPIFTSAGKLVDKPGYDKDSKSWVALPKEYTGPLSIDESLGVIDNWLTDFPFKSEADKANCLAFAITPILRPMISGPVPITRFEAPQPGTGKSLLAKIILIAITGASKMLPMSDSHEEMEKKIQAALMQLPQIIMFDNANKISASSLALAVSSTWFENRVLGLSKTATVPVICAWGVTINNAQMSQEFLRRTVRVRLDANMPHPEDKTDFIHPNIESYTRLNRGTIISALLGMCQYGLANQSESKVPPLGSFEDWSKTVGRVLEACGFEGFLATIKDDRSEASSGEDDALESFVESWASEYGTNRVTPKELAAIATSTDGFPAKRKENGEVSAESVGWQLRKHRGHQFPSGKIEGPGKSGSKRFWWLSMVKNGDGQPQLFSSSQQNDATSDRDGVTDCDGISGRENGVQDEMEF